MIGWIGKLCALCAMSALIQMMLPQEQGRDGVRMVCGLLMLRLTCECGAAIMAQAAESRDLSQLFACLIK